MLGGFVTAILYLLMYFNWLLMLFGDVIFLFFIFVFSRAVPAAYGGSQARGLIGATTAAYATATAPQLMATPDP